MPLAVVGVSHHTAPVEVRERIAYAGPDASRALLELRERSGVDEAVLLSTCNRTEVYLHPVRGSSAIEAVEQLFSDRIRDAALPDGNYLFRREGGGVVSHLFAVAAGLDSMVLGEAEIQGQVRDAYQRAAELSVSPPLTGPILNRLFQTALSVGGQIREETAINEGSASVASVAVELARKIFGRLRGKRILILGAGTTAELMVEALAREGVRGVLVVNRTPEHAEELAARMDGEAVPLEGLSDSLSEVDIILSSTASPQPILTREEFRRAFPRGRSHPILIIDIAMPRDVDPSIGELDEVFLYNVDDLRRIVEEHVQMRSSALPAADRIIQAREQEFRGWYASREVVPVIRRMRESAERDRQAELERLFRRLGDLDSEAQGRIEEFSRRLSNKLLHGPTVRLRKGMAKSANADLVDAVRFLYGLESEVGGTESGAGSTDESSPEQDSSHRDERTRGEAARRPTSRPQHGAVE